MVHHCTGRGRGWDCFLQVGNYVGCGFVERDVSRDEGTKIIVRKRQIIVSFSVFAKQQQQQKSVQLQDGFVYFLQIVFV